MSDDRRGQWYSQQPAALILVDVQNSFFHPQGESFYPAAREIVPNLQRLLATARQHDRLIVHVSDCHRGGMVDFESHKLPAHGLAGSFNADFYEGFGPGGSASSREVEIIKRRYSAFFGTDLDMLLREQAIERLVVAGVKTNICVRATIQDGFGLGYKCLLAREATNSNRPHLAAASLEDIDRYMGWVVDLEEASEALA